MELDDSVLALFHAQITTSDCEPVIEVPEREVQVGPMEQDTTYRIAVIEEASYDELSKEDDSQQNIETQPSSDICPQPPVSEGDKRTVTIEDIGREGDGMAKIDGYTVFVPGSQIDETHQVEITRVQDRYAFAEPVSGDFPDDATLRT